MPKDHVSLSLISRAKLMFSLLRGCVLYTVWFGKIRKLTSEQLWQPHTVSCAVWRVSKMPVFGLYMKLCRAVFVDPPKDSGLTNKKVILDAAKMLRREGMNLVMFPVRLPHPY